MSVLARPLVAMKQAVHLKQAAGLRVREAWVERGERVALAAQEVIHFTEQELTLIQWDQ